MENKEELVKILTAYLEEFRFENQNKLSDFLNRSSNFELYDRKQSLEHITASALIVNVKERTVLLLMHETLKKYLQPGGHIESDDSSILSAAIREAVEETGIKEENLVNLSIHFSENIPLDIDSHIIPENKIKNEPAHFHHDFRYLFTYLGDDKIRPKNTKTKGLKWVKFSELSSDQTFSNLLEKIRKILSLEFKTKLYYDTVVRNISQKKSLIR